MSNEFRPFGTGCNIRCDYCYEESTRAAGHAVGYDRDAVWPILENATESWSLFGGEALMLPLDQLEELLALGYKKFGSTGVQTNGTLITDRHLALFAKYNTHAGISLDGPGELNDIRKAGSIEKTREMTARTEKALVDLCALTVATQNSHLRPSIIVTLHAGNIGTPDRRARMMAWFHDLDVLGITHINLHVMEMDYRANEWAVTHEVGLAFLLDLWREVPTFTGLRIKKFKEILTLLQGSTKDTFCVWHACDPWNTGAVQGLDGDGSPGGCTRTCKDGKTWLPASGSGVPTRHNLGGFAGNRHHERQLSLYVTPQENGGCKDCRFWLMCQGQCPGTGIASESEPSGDWRQRSSYCATWKGLFEEGERRLVATDQVPLSLRPDRLEIEHRVYAGWVAGHEASMSDSLPQNNGQTQNGHTPHGDAHGDHLDAALQTMPTAPPRAHGDAPHQNVHGDHMDEARV